MQVWVQEQIKSFNSSGQNNSATPITRALVLGVLGDPDVGHDPELYTAQYCVVDDRTASSCTPDKTTTTSMSLSGSLSGVIAWLEMLCEVEQASIDWTLEYAYQRSSRI